MCLQNMCVGPYIACRRFLYSNKLDILNRTCDSDLSEATKKLIRQTQKPLIKNICFLLLQAIRFFKDANTNRQDSGL